MALIKCPHCGQTVSDSASQCPHCQYQLVTSSQRKHIQKNSLIALWLCIVGTVLNTFCQCRKILVNTQEISTGNVIVGILVIISGICLSLCWYFWLVREKSVKYPALNTSIVICIILICIRILRLIIPFINNYSATTLIIFVLSFAFGITLFFLNTNGKIKSLTHTIGVLYIINYIIPILWFIASVTHIEQHITNTLPYMIIDEVIWVSTLVLTIVLFYNTYKQSKII